MAHFRPSLLARSCALALIAAPGFSPAATPWQAIDGAKVAATHDYSTSTARDYPLFASGAGSLLTTGTPGLNFSTSGSLLHAAQASNGGRIELDGANLRTNGMMANGANISDTRFVMRDGSIHTLGSSSNGVLGSNGAQIDLTDVAMQLDGRDSIGVNLAQGQLRMQGGSIRAGGEGSGGLLIGSGTAGNVSAMLEDVSIDLSGNGTRATIELGNGTLSGSNLTLTGSDRHRGIEIYNPRGGSGRGTLVLRDSQITSAAGDGIYTLGGDVTLENVVVNSVDGMAVNVNDRSTMDIQGGSFSTTGDNAHTLWIASADSSVRAANTRVTSQGAGSHAFHAQFGNAQLSNVAISAEGANSYGLYTEAEVQAQDLTLNTAGKGAIGIFAARGGRVQLDRAQVQTQGTNGVGLLAYPGSQIDGQQVTVLTTGEQAHGLWARAGTINLQDSSVTTQGAGAAGLYLSGNPNNDASSVTLSNSAVSSAATALVMQSTTANVQLRDGTQLAGKEGLLEVRSGEHVSQLTLTADNQVQLQGDVRADDDSQVTLALSRQSQLTGAVHGLDTLDIDSSSQWQLGGSSALGALHNGGTVRFAAPASGFSVLDSETLSGNGTFLMHTDLAALQGDLLRVNGTASGDHRIGITNSGREPGRTDEALTIVNTSGGNAHFGLIGDHVDAGAWRYHLEQRGNDWVLAQQHDDKGNPLPTPTAATVTALFNAAPVTWYGEMSTLRQRMGEVRDSEQSGGVWTRLTGNSWHISPRSGVAWKQSLHGVALGVDSATHYEQGQRLLGVFTGVSKSQLTFDQGSSGTLNSYYIGGYASWLAQDGWFADAVVKANNFSSQADARMSDGTPVSGGFQTAGLGVSLELGRKLSSADGWFAEPSLQLSSLWVSGERYRLSNDMQASASGTGSRQAALNLVGGREFALQGEAFVQPWLRAALVHEFASRDTVRVNDQGMNADLSGQRVELGAGASWQINRDLQLYSDASWSQGDKLRMPWNASVGMRWRW